MSLTRQIHPSDGSAPREEAWRWPLSICVLGFLRARRRPWMGGAGLLAEAKLL